MSSISRNSGRCTTKNVPDSPSNKNNKVLAAHANRKKRPESSSQEVVTDEPGVKRRRRDSTTRHRQSDRRSLSPMLRQNRDNNSIVGTIDRESSRRQTMARSKTNSGKLHDKRTSEIQARTRESSVETPRAAGTRDGECGLEIQQMHLDDDDEDKKDETVEKPEIDVEIDNLIKEAGVYSVITNQIEMCPYKNQLLLRTSWHNSANAGRKVLRTWMNNSSQLQGICEEVTEFYRLLLESSDDPTNPYNVVLGLHYERLLEHYEEVSRALSTVSTLSRDIVSINKALYNAHQKISRARSLKAN